MKETDKKSIAAFCAAAVVLTLVSLLLTPLKEESIQKQRMEVMPFLLPGSTAFRQEAYRGDSKEIQEVYKGTTGFVVATRTDGYSGKVDLLVGVNNSGIITGLLVWDMKETYGLGSGVLHKEEFLAQFLATGGDAVVGKTIDALTGATVTSKAIARGVNAASAFVTGADIESGATQWKG